MAEPTEPRLEDLLARLEELVRALECEDLDLERSLEAYEEGVGIARACHEKLDQAEQRVEVLRRLPSGQVVSAPLERRET